MSIKACTKMLLNNYMWRGNMYSRGQILKVFLSTYTCYSDVYKFTSNSIGARNSTKKGDSTRVHNHRRRVRQRVKYITVRHWHVGHTGTLPGAVMYRYVRQVRVTSGDMIRRAEVGGKPARLVNLSVQSIAMVHFRVKVQLRAINGYILQDPL